MTVRANFVSGTTTNNPLASSGTTLNSAGLASLPSVSSDTAKIVLGYDTASPEIVYVTAHTASATSATISRGKEGTAAQSWGSGTKWIHAGTVDDFAFVDAENVFTAQQLVDLGAATNHMGVGDTTTTAGTFYVRGYTGARGIVVQQPDSGANDFIELQDASGVVVGQWTSDGAVQSSADNHYFGPNAFGAVGVRARIYTSAGTVGILAESDGTTPDVAAILRPKGDGEAQLQNSAGSDVVTAGLVSGARALGFFGTAPIVKPTVTGSRGGNAALASLLTKLESLGLLVDSST